MTASFGGGPIEPSLWETITHTPMTKRLKVADGWLYCVEKAGCVSICHVPDPIDPSIFLEEDNDAAEITQEH